MMRRSSFIIRPLVAPTMCSPRLISSGASHPPGAVNMGHIPIIDASSLYSSDVSMLRKTATEIKTACTSVGFFYLTNHGVPPDVITTAASASRAFFNSPLEERLKARLPSTEYPYGYSPLASEIQAQSLGEKTLADLNETFSMGPSSLIASNSSRVVSRFQEFAYSPNIWPPQAGFRDALSLYYMELNRLSLQLLRVFALALDVDESYFLDKVNMHMASLRVNYYPKLLTSFPVGANQFRAGAHTDYGCFTILWQQPHRTGLEVKGKEDGVWHPVPPIDGTFVVNLGDMMQRWTNEMWVSNVHRVVVAPNNEKATPPPPPCSSTAQFSGGGGVANTAGIVQTGVGDNCERLSMAYFFIPNADAVVSCIPSCVRGATKHKPVTAGDYIMAKYSSTKI